MAAALSILALSAYGERPAFGSGTSAQEHKAKVTEAPTDARSHKVEPEQQAAS